MSNNSAQIQALTQSLSNLRVNANSNNAELNRAKARRTQLQQLLTSIISKSQQKRQISHNLENSTHLGSKQDTEIQNRISSTKSLSQQKNSELESTQTEIGSIETRIRSIDQRLRDLNNIIGAPRIQPVYGYEGGKCSNGVLNCKNHPNEVRWKQVIVNQGEIDAQKREIEDCIERRTRLLSEKDELHRELNRLRHKCVSLRGEIATSERQQTLDLNKHKTMETQIHQATQARVSVNSDYQSLIQERVKTQRQLAEVESQIQGLMQQQMVDNNSILTMTTELANAKSETQNNSTKPLMSSDRRPASAPLLVLGLEALEAAGGLAFGAAVTKRVHDQTNFIMEHTEELYDRIRGPPPSVEQDQHPFRAVSTLPVQAVPNTSTVTPWGTPVDTSTTTVSQPSLSINTFNKNQGDEVKDPIKPGTVKDRAREFERMNTQPIQWQITNPDKVVLHPNPGIGKIERDPKTQLWWSKD
jgi:chromosome segregation ATPase